MPTKKDIKYVVEQPFDFKRWFEVEEKHYEPGDEFVMPEGLTRDAAFDPFRMTDKKHVPHGVAFVEVGDVVSGEAKDRQDPKAERTVIRHVLPLKEA